MTRVIREGSVRVDLFGGTLDLPPIHLNLPNVVTLNFATSLKARVELRGSSENGVRIISKDYDTECFFDASEFTEDNLRENHFKELNFIAWILYYGRLTRNLELILESGSPAGAGLGGSSAMGVTLYEAILDMREEPVAKSERQRTVRVVRGLEGIILDRGPAGYQDYYPALYGGVLALHPSTEEEVKVEQLYSEELAEYIHSHVTLVYSGQTRNSGINNWEVYKGYFDRDPKIRAGLQALAHVAHEAYADLKECKLDKFLDLLIKEGQIRSELFPGIMTPEMETVFRHLKTRGLARGIKICGAGGGGCFLLIHDAGQREALRSEVKAQGMEVLDYRVEPPV